jgi:hypothetical protein
MVLAALGAGPGRTEDMPDMHGTHGMGHEAMHYWYKTLKQPGTGMSCCNDTDCRPTASRMVGDKVEVVIDGRWVTVPPDKILKTPSPDLASHVCAPKQSMSVTPAVIYCVVLGSGA